MTFLLIVTLSSMLVAVIMSLIAWRMAAEERRRSEARIAALAAAIHAPASAVSTNQQGARPQRVEVAMRGEPSRVAAFPSPRPVMAWDDDLRLHPERSEPPVELFASAQRSPNRSRLVVFAVAALVIGGGATAAFMAAGRGAAPSAALATSSVRDNRGAAPAATPPLELVALGHERDGERLTVRGVVRNPSAGAALDRVAAVVFGFDTNGGFVTSARSSLDALLPAGEATFSVVVPDAANATRYRVSFRSGDRIVPHVDKRELKR
jgi:hypothetical protein